MRPRVSIVIPAFNNVAYLGETLQAALSQDYDNYEVVVADHSSTDATAEILATFATDPRLRVLEPTPTGGGAQRNWNRVSQAATGELIKLLPGDDLISTTMLSAQVSAFERYPSLTLCSTRRNLINENGRTIMRGRGLPNGLIGVHSGATVVRKTVRAGTNLLGEPGSVLMRRDALEAIDWWDGTNPYVIDERTYCRVLLADKARGRGDFFGVAKPLSSFRVSGGQWSVQLATSQSRQVSAFHNFLAQEHPDAVSHSDAMVGNTRASLMAYARRLVYMALGFRKKN